MGNPQIVQVQPVNNPRVATTSARDFLSRKHTLSLKDIKGFKKCEALENFYEILDSIG